MDVTVVCEECVDYVSIKALPTELPGKVTTAVGDYGSRRLRQSAAKLTEARELHGLIFGDSKHQHQA